MHTEHFRKCTRLLQVYTGTISIDRSAYARAGRPRAAAAPAGPDGAAHVAAAHLPSPPSARAFAAPGRLWL